VDALREVHTKLLKITKAYESESVSAASWLLLILRDHFAA